MGKGEFEKVEETLIQLLSKLDKLIKRRKVAHKGYKPHWIIKRRKSNYGDHDTSIKLYKKALELINDSDDLIGLGVTYNNIELVFKAMNQYDMALEYYHNALIIMQRIGYKSNSGHILSNIDAIYKEKRDYKIALDYYNRSLEIAKELNGIKQFGIIYSLIGVVYLDLNELEKSIQNTNTTFTIFNNIGDKKLITNSYKTLG